MKTSDLLRFAALYLWRRKTRAILTVTGVIIGTTCIVLMFAIGLAGYEQFQQSIMTNVDLTQIQINSNGGGAQGVQSSGISDSAIASIKAIKDVKAVSPIIYIPVTVQAGKYKATLQLNGIDPSVLDGKFQEGKMFSGNLPSIVLGANTMQQFVDPENPPDYQNMQDMQSYKPDIDWMHTSMTLQIGYGGDVGSGGTEGAQSTLPPSKTYRAIVSGIFANAQDQQSYSSYISLDVAKQLIRENMALAKQMNISATSYQAAVIQVDDINNVESVLDEVKKLGYQTYSPVDSIQQAQQQQSQQQGQLLAIGFISLIVSAIGIANTMYASILERRRDIGIMKVLGMKIRKIRLLFLTESAMIGLFGGLIGIAVSFITTFIISSGGGNTSFLGIYFSTGMSVQIPAWLALMALGIAAGVGILSGIYPAYKATKTSPLEAMRGSN